MDLQTSGAALCTCAKAVGIWVLSVLLAVPEAVFSEVASVGGVENGSFTACIPYPQTDELHPKIHSVLIFLVYFLIPLAIISVYYYHIAKTLIKSAHNLPGEYNEHTKKTGKLDRCVCAGVRRSGTGARSVLCLMGSPYHGIRTGSGRWDVCSLNKKGCPGWRGGVL